MAGRFLLCKHGSHVITAVRLLGFGGWLSYQVT